MTSYEEKVTTQLSQNLRFTLKQKKQASSPAAPVPHKTACRSPHKMIASKQKEA